VIGGVVGTIMSIAIRAELMHPASRFSRIGADAAGVDPAMALDGGKNLYNVFITAHGVLMIFYMVMPALIAATPTGSFRS